MNYMKSLWNLFIKILLVCSIVLALFTSYYSGYVSGRLDCFFLQDERIVIPETDEGEYNTLKTNPIRRIKEWI